MVHLSPFLTIFLVLGSIVHATTWTPPKFAVAGAPVGVPGARIFFFNGNSLQVLFSDGLPASTGNYNTWVFGDNFATHDPIFTNVASSSDIAAVAYVSPTTQTPRFRVFFQTTDGSIRSLTSLPDDSGWQLDATAVATGLPLGTPIAAFQTINSAGQLAVLVQYGDVDGRITQSFTTTDGSDWSEPITVTT